MSLFLESVYRWICEFMIGELLYDILQALTYVWSNYPELTGMFFISVGVSVFLTIIRLVRRLLF